jgi:uncharacterized protein (DUF2252 family)
MSKSARRPSSDGRPRRLGTAAIGLGLSAAVASFACAAPNKAPERPRAASIRPFDVDLASMAQPLDPALVSRVRQSPTTFFRFVNVAFGNEVCRLFQPQLSSMGVVSLHGDPHLLQYAITDTGRGLTDFDDAASGPPVLDLLRFSTSLVLACRARGWDGEIDAVLDGFFRGYRSALADPRVATPEPEVVGRTRAGFRFDPAHYFGWLRSNSEPLPGERRLAIEKALAPYVDTMLTEEPTLTREYFRVIEMGRSRMGIGSARTLKYVVRLRGRTDIPNDDDVLELKEVGPLPNVSCLSPASTLDPMRQIVAQARMVYEPYRLVGYVVIDQRYFWVHAWARSYHELSLYDLQTPAELSEVAVDAGKQLGLGHPKLATPPQDASVRTGILRFLDARRAEFGDLSRMLADEVTSSWSRFRDQTHGETRR